MIRINLLEVREERRKMALRNLAIFSVLMLAVTGVSVYFWHSGLVEDIEYAKQRIRNEEAEIQRLNKIVGEVEQIKDKKKDLEQKLEVIRGLEEHRAEIVDLLLAVSEVLSEEIWFLDMSVTGKQISAKAQAVDMQSVGLMIKKLKADPRFENPQTSGIKASKDGFVSFSLTFEFVPPQSDTEKKNEKS